MLAVSPVGSPAWMVGNTLRTPEMTLSRLADGATLTPI